MQILLAQHCSTVNWMLPNDLKAELWSNALHSQWCNESLICHVYSIFSIVETVPQVAFLAFCVFYAFLRIWPVEVPWAPQQVRVLKWKNTKKTKIYLIELGLLICTLDIFCIFCMFCIFCIFFCKYANLTYYIFGIMCIFVIFMTQCDWLRCRRQQHKLSWSDDFQYSWWSRLTRWKIIGDHHTSKSPSKGRQILRVSKQWGTWQGEVLIMSRTCRLLCFSQASIPTTLLPFKKGDCATGPDPMCMTNERCTRGSRLKLWKEKLLRFHPQLSNCLRIVQTKSIKDATAYCHYQRGFLNIFNINCICCIIYIFFMY